MSETLTDDQVMAGAVLAVARKVLTGRETAVLEAVRLGEFNPTKEKKEGHAGTGSDYELFTQVKTQFFREATGWLAKREKMRAVRLMQTTNFYNE